MGQKHGKTYMYLKKHSKFICIFKRTLMYPYTELCIRSSLYSPQYSGGLYSPTYACKTNTLQNKKNNNLLHPKCPTKYRTAWHYTAGPDGTPFLPPSHTHTQLFTHNIEEQKHRQWCRKIPPCTTHPFTACTSISGGYSCELKVLSACEHLKNYKDVFYCSLNVRGFEDKSKATAWRGNASTRRDKE